MARGAKKKIVNSHHIQIIWQENHVTLDRDEVADHLSTLSFFGAPLFVPMRHRAWYSKIAAQWRDMEMGPCAQCPTLKM